MATYARPKSALTRDKDVLLGIVVLCVVFLFLLLGIPDRYKLFIQLRTNDLIFEFIATFISFGLFTIFLARYFLLHNIALLFLATAFFSAFLADLVRSFGFAELSLLSYQQYQILHAIAFGSTKIIFIILLVLSAFSFERLVQKDDIGQSCLRFLGFTSVFTVVVSALVVYIAPRFIMTKVKIEALQAFNYGIVCIGALLITGSCIAATKYYRDFIKKKNKLQLWFTMAIAASIAADTYFLSFAGKSPISQSFALILRILSYTTFTIGMVNDYIWYLLKEKEISWNLEKIVIKRTEELQIKNRELEQKTKESLEASRLKSELLANMSHELRTPMNAIIGFTHRVIKKTEDVLPEKQMKNLRTVERNAHHLLGLINSILDVSKVEAGRMEVLVEPFNMYHLIEEVVEMTAPLAGEKPIKLLFDCPGEMYMNSDRTKIKQMLINLVGNSMKFTEEGGVKISVRNVKNPLGVQAHEMPAQDSVFGKQTIAVRKKKDAFVQILVSDTGVGIKEENIPFIFDEFRQVDGSLTRQTGGTGLGLAIVKKFSILLGGNVTVESKYKRGTCFTITLPLDSSFASKSKADIEKEQAGLPIQYSVLCASGNEQLIKTVKGVMDESGFAFNVVSHIEEIVPKAKETRPLVIIVDFLMAQGSFFDAVQEIKAEPITAVCPVIGLSVSADGSRHYSLLGADFISKPVSQRPVIESLYRIAVYRPVRNVLIVDDAPEAETEFAPIFENEKQLSITYSSNGQDALQRCRRQRPDVALIDLVMVGMDGLEVYEEIKKDDALKDLPIIFMTSKSADEQELVQFKERIAHMTEKNKEKTEHMLLSIINVARSA